MPVVRRGDWAAEVSALHTAANDGVITARELERLGVPAVTIYRRCRGGGPWSRMLPGVIRLSNGHPTRNQLVAAALAYAGPDALVTGLEACRRHGIRRGPRQPSDDIHLLVPHAKQLRAYGFVYVERTRRLPGAIRRDAVPLAPVARACIDAARRLRCPREVTELLADPIQRGSCSVAQLRAELAACGRRGSATPRRVLADIGDGVRSAAERDAKRVWRRTGLPEPWWNASVFDERGRLLGIADAWCDDVAMTWEIDSYEFHLSPGDYARTVGRAARLAAAGVVVVPTLPSRLRRDPAGVVAELRAAYAAASTRPRPPLRAVRP